MNNHIVASANASREFHDPVVFSRTDQITYAALAILSALTLAVARMFTPSAKGYGTHEQLGLPPCLFFKWTGIPCPNCGLTTSFAHSARFHFYQAFITQPFGLLAFCLTVASIPLFMFLMRHHVSWVQLLRVKSIDRLIRILITIYLLSWIYKIIVIKLPVA
ncbi:MAG TPA: DUF2752 domain-containing protein [Blastocatellia bacterium]|nr:DUF2752 domain-containing protein [Blastocatellia bacterium]